MRLQPWDIAELVSGEPSLSETDMDLLSDSIHWDFPVSTHVDPCLLHPGTL